jgi:hypothetical protein
LLSKSDHKGALEEIIVKGALEDFPRMYKCL